MVKVKGGKGIRGHVVDSYAYLHFLLQLASTLPAVPLVVKQDLSYRILDTIEFAVEDKSPSSKPIASEMDGGLKPENLPTVAQLQPELLQTMQEHVDPYSGFSSDIKKELDHFVLQLRQLSRLPGAEYSAKMINQPIAQEALDVVCTALNNTKYSQKLPVLQMLKDHAGKQPKDVVGHYFETTYFPPTGLSKQITTKTQTNLSQRTIHCTVFYDPKKGFGCIIQDGPTQAKDSAPSKISHQITVGDQVINTAVAITPNDKEQLVCRSVYDKNSLQNGVSSTFQPYSYNAIHVVSAKRPVPSFQSGAVQTNYPCYNQTLDMTSVLPMVQQTIISLPPLEQKSADAKKSETQEKLEENDKAFNEEIKKYSESFACLLNRDFHDDHDKNSIVTQIKLSQTRFDRFMLFIKQFLHKYFSKSEQSEAPDAPTLDLPQIRQEIDSVHHRDNIYTFSSEHIDALQHALKSIDPLKIKKVDDQTGDFIASLDQPVQEMHQFHSALNAFLESSLSEFEKASNLTEIPYIESFCHRYAQKPMMLLHLKQTIIHTISTLGVQNNEPTYRLQNALGLAKIQIDSATKRILPTQSEAFHLQQQLHCFKSVPKGGKGATPPRKSTSSSPSTDRDSGLSLE